MIEGYSENTLDLVPDTIKGFRLFYILEMMENLWYYGQETRGGAIPTRRVPLRSLTVPYFWDESGWNYSRCYKYGVPSSVHKAGAPSSVHKGGIERPGGRAYRIDKDCSCGFYACHSIETLIDQGYYAATVGGVSYYNLGFVEASGTVFLGPKGFRAERMRIIDLIPNPSYSEAMNFQYSHPTSSIEELLKR